MTTQDTTTNDVLDELLAQADTAGIKSRIASTPAAAPDRLQGMMSIFQQAFPEQDFSIMDGSVIGTAKVAAPKAAVPSGYTPEKADVGIRELQTSLEQKDLSDEDKYSIAIRLNTLVQTQKMYKFEQYKNQAESQYGIPDIVTAIEAVKRAELASPYNPGNGIPSRQRMELITQLGTARGQAALRVKDLMGTDPVYAQAENLAGGVMAEIEGRLKIGDRSDRLENRRQLKEAREAQISSIDPNVIASISIMRNGKPIPTNVESRSIAEQLIDGKLKLNKTEQFLVTANDDNIKSMYLVTKDVKEKQLALRVLEGRETLAVGDADQAKNNIRLFEAVMKIDPSNKEDPRVSPDMRRRWATIKQDVIKAKAEGSSKSDEELTMERKFALHREILKDAVTKEVFGNVKNWEGLIASDQAAQAVLKIWHGNRNMNVNDFIDHYLEYNDGRKAQDKSGSLQAIITSAIEALPRSSILPIPSPESALLEAKKLVLARSVTKSFYSSGVMGLDLLRSNLPGIR